MNHYLSAFRRYTDFAGRASRPEFWLFLVPHLVVAAALGGIAA